MDEKILKAVKHSGTAIGAGVLLFGMYKVAQLPVKAGNWIGEQLESPVEWVTSTVYNAPRNIKNGVNNTKESVNAAVDEAFDSDYHKLDGSGKFKGDKVCIEAYIGHEEKDGSELSFIPANLKNPDGTRRSLDDVCDGSGMWQDGWTISVMEDYDNDGIVDKADMLRNTTNRNIFNAASKNDGLGSKEQMIYTSMLNQVVKDVYGDINKAPQSIQTYVNNVNANAELE